MSNKDIIDLLLQDNGNIVNFYLEDKESRQLDEKINFSQLQVAERKENVIPRKQNAALTSNGNAVWSMSKREMNDSIEISFIPPKRDCFECLRVIYANKTLKCELIERDFFPHSRIFNALQHINVNKTNFSYRMLFQMPLI